MYVRINGCLEQFRDGVWIFECSISSLVVYTYRYKEALVFTLFVGMKGCYSEFGDGM